MENKFFLSFVSSGRMALLFLMLPSFVFSQTYVGDFQFDKTLDGSMVKSYHNVTISFVDPKRSTNVNSEVQNRPTGSLIIKVVGLKEPIKYTIIYINSTEGGDIYSIISTDDDNNVLAVMRTSHTEGNKTYSYFFRTGGLDPSTMRPPLLYYTDFYCNRVQASQK